MSAPLPPIDPGYVVTLRDIWNELRVLSAKLDAAASQVALHDSKVADLSADHVDYEARIRALEKARWPLPTLGVLVSIAAVFVAVIALYHK